MPIDTAIALMYSLMDMSSLLAADSHHPGYNLYTIEIGPIGYSISARPVPHTESGYEKRWEIRAFTTYNA